MKKLLKNKNKYTFFILVLMATNIIVIDLVLLNVPLIGNVKSLISQKVESSQRDQIFEEINPSKGYELNVSYNDLGPKMLALGVIDLDKFKNAEGQISSENLDILTKGSNQKIKITRENSHFLLNFFWALGLANNSKILTDGQMQTYGGDPSNFASTGGWTLGKDTSMTYYSKSDFIKLTPDQESLVQKVANNIYRPCCDNSTAFPDCNHGMALLGALELMAANGATEVQMYDSAKYINAFWFPSNYYDVAKYLQMNGGKSFSQTDARTILGKDFSSASGYAQIKKWLDSQNGVQQNSGQGGASCGV